MENDYYTKGTSLVKTALLIIPVITGSLVPSVNCEIPQQKTPIFEDYAQLEKQSTTAIVSKMAEKEQAEILLSFANKLAENTKDLDNDLAQIISDDFWEMYDRF